MHPRKHASRLLSTKHAFTRASVLSPSYLIPSDLIWSMSMTGLILEWPHRFTQKATLSMMERWTHSRLLSPPAIAFSSRSSSFSHAFVFIWERPSLWRALLSLCCGIVSVLWPLVPHAGEKLFHDIDERKGECECLSVLVSFFFDRKMLCVHQIADHVTHLRQRRNEHAVCGGAIRRNQTRVWRTGALWRFV